MPEALKEEPKHAAVIRLQFRVGVQGLLGFTGFAAVSLHMSPCLVQAERGFVRQNSGGKKFRIDSVGGPTPAPSLS